MSEELFPWTHAPSGPAGRTAMHTTERRRDGDARSRSGSHAALGTLGAPALLAFVLVGAPAMLAALGLLPKP